MDGMQNWTNYLEVMRNRLLIVNDADSLISVLMDVRNIPIALSTVTATAVTKYISVKPNLRNCENYGHN